MRILVTGASGLIGRSLSALLRSEGHKVRALSRNPATAELPEADEVVGGDLGDPESLVNTLSGMDGMYLFSAERWTVSPPPRAKHASSE